MPRRVIQVLIGSAVLMAIIGCVYFVLMFFPTRGEMNRNLANCGLSIPDSATDVQIHFALAVDPIYYVRFHIPMAELDGALGRMSFSSVHVSSPPEMFFWDFDVDVRSWWQPASLENVRFAMVSVPPFYTHAMAGEADGIAIVYLFYSTF